MAKAYTAAYFEKLGKYYQETSKTALGWGHNKTLCNMILNAGTQLRMAAQELK